MSTNPKEILPVHILIGVQSYPKEVHPNISHQTQHAPLTAFSTAISRPSLITCQRMKHQPYRSSKCIQKKTKQKQIDIPIRTSPKK